MKTITLNNGVEMPLQGFEFFKLRRKIAKRLYATRLTLGTA